MTRPRSLPSNFNLNGKYVLVRLDWNIPFDRVSRITHHESPDALKIERSLKTLREFKKRGAITVILTHLGRPERKDAKFSTRRLVPVLKKFKVNVQFLEGRVSEVSDRKRMVETIRRAKPGSVFLLENVRFEKGEEKNSKPLAKAYAELGDIFVNDAFASSHRAHASVVGIARVLPSYAGPELVSEIQTLSRLLDDPPRPFIAVVGGAKISTKIDALLALLKRCDLVCAGGAMASTIFAADGRRVGTSLVETSALRHADRIKHHRRLVLPADFVVADKKKHRTIRLGAIKPQEAIVDVGPKTIEIWRRAFSHARTILWNGPVGLIEKTMFAKGTEALARALADQEQAFVVAGGGDTIPVILKTGTESRFDFLSMGGGAMLEFIAKNGKLPGITCLVR